MAAGTGAGGSEKGSEITYCCKESPLVKEVSCSLFMIVRNENNNRQRSQVVTVETNLSDCICWNIYLENFILQNIICFGG